MAELASPSCPTSPWRRRLWSTIAVLILTFWFFSPVREIADIGLDSSNYASYSYFTGKEFQYGKEVLPMAGPYGFVPYGFNYSGNLFDKRFPLELLTKLVLGVLIVWFIRKPPRQSIIKGIWIISLLLLAPLITDLPYTLAILLAGLCLVECHVATDRRSLFVACALAAYLALLTLFKGTQCMLAGATLGLLCLQAVFSHHYRRLPWIIGSYFAALVFWLLIAGQNPLHFPAYVLGMLEISSGYNLAMGVEEPFALFLVGAGLLVGLQILILGSLMDRWREPRFLAGALFLAGFTFIAWKHGFVRADGHVTIYFNYVCVAVPTIMLYANVWSFSQWRRRGTLLLAGTIFLVGLRGDGTPVKLRWEGMQTIFRDQLALSIQQVFNPSQTKSELDAALEKNRIFYRLSRLQDVVGRDPIDFFGNEQGFLLLNRVNYRPRPVGGGTFSIFTPKLRTINQQWLNQEENRPEYYLVHVQSIDDRFVPQEDAGTLQSLIEGYTPIEVILGLPLLQKNDNALPNSSLHSLGTQALRWDHPVRVPSIPDDRILYASITIPPSLAGKARTFLYKPPPVFMDLSGTGIEMPHNRRIIPGMVSAPIPLNPLIENSTDLLNLYQRANTKQITQLTVKTPHPYAFEHERMQIEFFTGPRPPVSPPPPVSSRHPQISDIAPVDIIAPIAPVHRFDDYVAQVLVPPARMDFPLSEGDNAIAFSYGMLQETYVTNTDGTDIYVKLKRPGQPPQQLFTRHLDPVSIPEDRGVKTAVVSLPPFPPGSKVELSTGRGPDNDGAWDLVYFTKIKLLQGPYRRDQFPGFSRVPDRVNAGTNGRISDGLRELYLINAPGRLVFNLAATEQRITVSWGLLPGSYQNGGLSDGVEFTLTLRPPNGEEKLLFSHLCDPAREPADIGDRTFSIEIPPHPPGSQLMVSSLPGPNNDPSWDWAYIQSLVIE